MNRVVMFSGGIGSWAAARRVADEYGTTGLVLCFADTLMEDEDLYRFVEQAAADVGGEFVRLTEGRDPWQVFFDVRFLGNSQIDPCSRLLKREFLRKWLDETYGPERAVVYLGIDWTEAHRFEKARRHWQPYEVHAPMCNRPYVTKDEMLAQAAERGIEPPRLYKLGFPHNNCGGFCIKAGQAHFATLLRELPERYAYHERREQELGEHLGKTVTVLRDRAGGKTTPLTLRKFRERLEAQGSFDSLDWGGCGCFSP